MPEVGGVNSRDEEDEVDSLFREPVGDGPLGVISCHAYGVSHPKEGLPLLARGEG